VADTADAQVLIAGAGPIGLAAAIELALAAASTAASSTRCTNRRSTRKPLACNLVRLRYSKEWACCAASWTRHRDARADRVCQRREDRTARSDTADAAVTAAHGRIDVYLIASPGADVAGTTLPLVTDSVGAFARAYSASGSSVYIVRPDGYLGFAAASIDMNGLVTHLRATFA
jgi:threonine dehydrogenase-like Zn-dependent dehydrogenase